MPRTGPTSRTVVSSSVLLAAARAAATAQLRGSSGAAEPAGVSGIASAPTSTTRRGRRAGGDRAPPTGCVVLAEGDGHVGAASRIVGAHKLAHAEGRLQPLDLGAAGFVGV